MLSGSQLYHVSKSYREKKIASSFLIKLVAFGGFDMRKLDEEEATDTRINNPKYTIKDRKDTEVVLPLK